MAESIKVKVSVPNRGPYGGFGSAGVYWPIGDSEGEVSPEQLSEIQGDEKAGMPIRVSVIPPAAAAAPEPVKPTPPPGKSK